MPVAARFLTNSDVALRQRIHRQPSRAHYWCREEQKRCNGPTCQLVQVVDLVAVANFNVVIGTAEERQKTQGRRCQRKWPASSAGAPRAGEVEVQLAP